jgi:hypothetical protein
LSLKRRHGFGKGAQLAQVGAGREAQDASRHESGAERKPLSRLAGQAG